VKRVPTDAEIDAAAIELGLAVDGKCPRNKRAKVARAVALVAEEKEAESSAPQHDSGIDAVLAAYQRIRDADIGPADAAVLTAAIAPAIFRTALERNRT
jgi:hypothetical protein